MLHRHALLGLLVGALTMLASTGTALAGRVVVTGHDADYHCASQQKQCHFFKTVVDQVRSTAPNPGAKLLVIDRTGSGQNEVQRALSTAYPGATPAADVLDPTKADFASELGRLDTGIYSALLVASDTSCGGCDLNSSSDDADSRAINAVEASTHVIQKFFSANGGVVFFAGARHGDGSDPMHNSYYASVPVGVTGLAVRPPFKLTPTGLGFGLFDRPVAPGQIYSDINCCETHNSFAEPSGPFADYLKVLERDNGNSSATPPVGPQVETLFGDICFTGGSAKLCPSKSTAGTVSLIALPKRLLFRKTVRIRIPRVIAGKGNVISGKLIVARGARSKVYVITPGGVVSFKPSKLRFLKRRGSFVVREELLTDLNLLVRFAKTVKTK
jgi:hypothetical protein